MTHTKLKINLMSTTNHRAIKPPPDEKLWEVWNEGYAATGEHATATFLNNPSRQDGKWPGKTFKDACKLALTSLKWDMKFYEERTNSYWACRFYDNETQARKNFG